MFSVFRFYILANAPCTSCAVLCQPHSTSILRGFAPSPRRLVPSDLAAESQPTQMFLARHWCARPEPLHAIAATNGVPRDNQKCSSRDVFGRLWYRYIMIYIYIDYVGLGYPFFKQLFHGGNWPNHTKPMVSDGFGPCVRAAVAFSSSPIGVSLQLQCIRCPQHSSPPLPSSPSSPAYGWLHPEPRNRWCHSSFGVQFMYPSPQRLQAEFSLGTPVRVSQIRHLSLSLAATLWESNLAMENPLQIASYMWKSVINGFSIYVSVVYHVWLPEGIHKILSYQSKPHLNSHQYCDQIAPIELYKHQHVRNTPNSTVVSWISVNTKSPHSPQPSWGLAQLAREHSSAGSAHPLLPPGYWSP